MKRKLDKLGLHVLGFHEGKLDIDTVAFDLSYAEWNFEYTKNSSK